MKNETWKAAIYLRISKDDEGNGESGSISNQRQMLMSFLSGRQDLFFVAEYADDGWSGYDFNRPQFQQMIQAAKNGEINCIIVKDFSRLGRNFQKTEEYLQRIFPKLGVRFIAVANCFDSIREQSSSERIANPVMNLMNEFHVMETSQKVRNVLEHYRKNGKFIGNHAPYGYLIEDKLLVVDEKAAQIVNRIFEMKIEGISNQGIADELNRLGVKSPLEHKIEIGVSTTGKHLRDGDKAVWCSTSVRRILENPVYIGTLIQGKTTSRSYRDKRRIQTALCELKAFENAHDAIISDTVFLIVQDLLSRDGYSNPMKQSYLFSGFIFCQNCGKQMYHRQDEASKPAFWVCKNKDCHCKGKIKEKSLCEAVLATLKTHIHIVLDFEYPVTLEQNCTADSGLMDLQQESLTHEIDCLKKKKAHLFNLSHDRKIGIIPEDDFEEMNDYYDAKIKNLEFQIMEIQNRKNKLLDCTEEIIDIYRKYVDMIELTRAAIVIFTERIEISGKDKVRIFFRYENILKFGGDTNGS